MRFDKNFGFTRDFDKPHADDDAHPHTGVMVEFYETFRPLHDARGQAIKGPDGKIKMSDAVLMMKFHTVGDPKTLAHRKATDEDKMEWAKAFELFQKGKSFTEQAGTSLDALPDLDIMNRARLQSLGIFSIEQLSDLAESAILQNQDLRNWVNLARAYRLKNRPKPNQELLDEVAAMRAELAALKGAKKPTKQEGIAA